MFEALYILVFNTSNYRLFRHLVLRNHFTLILHYLASLTPKLLCYFMCWHVCELLVGRSLKIIFPLYQAVFSNHFVVTDSLRKTVCAADPYSIAIWIGDVKIFFWKLASIRIHQSFYGSLLKNPKLGIICSTCSFSKLVMPIETA